MTTLALPHAPDAAPQARRSLGAALRDLDLPRDLVDDALLVLSELVGNALRHAPPLPDGTIDIRWTAGGDVVTVSVTDGGAQTSPGVRPTDTFGTDGRGLWIVETLAVEWGVRRRERATTVWATLTCDGASAPVRFAGV